MAVSRAVWARLSADTGLASELRALPPAVADAVAQAAPEPLDVVPVAAVAFGSGPASVAALETELLLKEVARIPAEGVETREAATMAMTGLAQGHVAVSHSVRRGSALFKGSEAVCRRVNGSWLRCEPRSSMAFAVRTTPPAWECPRLPSSRWFDG